MKRIVHKTSGINPAKITGPYSLLAVMLLVAEILFTIWFYKADNSVERSIAGATMAVVFVSLMILITRINHNDSGSEREGERKKQSSKERPQAESINSNKNWIPCAIAKICNKISGNFHAVT